MNRALQEHIEAKIINFLRDTKIPIHASQIAARIQERREDTNHAIQRLVKNQTVHPVQDLAYFKSTGETMAYALADIDLKQPPIDPSIPIPPPQPHRPGIGRQL